MLYDADIRDGLCLFLESEYGKIRFFDEKTMGKSRADLLMVTESELIGIEIKSDADSYARLPSQIKDYDRFFDKNIIVAGSTHALHVSEHVPEHWGIIIVNEEGGKVDFYELRKPEKTGKPKLQKQIRMLWRRELANVQKKNGLYKYSGKSRAFVEKYVMKSVDAEKLKADLVEELFERDYTVFIN